MRISDWSSDVCSSGKLSVESSANQDSPLMKGIGSGNTPILGLDVREQAYYLKYQNRRPDYIGAFYTVVDWNEVERGYLEAIDRKSVVEGKRVYVSVDCGGRENNKKKKKKTK